MFAERQAPLMPAGGRNGLKTAPDYREVRRIMSCVPPRPPARQHAT